MKKVFSIFIIAIALLLALACTDLFTVPVHAADGSFTYEVHDGKATITGCNLTDVSYLEIPSIIDGYPVTAIGANAFQNRNDIYFVDFQEGIETIDYRAFWYCRNLIHAYLPDSLTAIGDEAFSACTSLYYVYLGDSLKDIGYAAFAQCSSLYSADFPVGLESIGMSAFYKCYSLESVYLPDSLKTIGDRAFDSCVRLSWIYMPDTLTSIGVNVLYNTACYNDSYYWYGDAMYVGPYLLQAKKSISGSYTVEPGTILIANDAFKNCYTMTQVTLPSSLQVIGANAFYSCDSLTSVTIPANVHTIGDKAFYWCENLTDVAFSGLVSNIGQDVFTRTPYYNNEENWENNAFYIGPCLVSSKGTITGTFQVRPGTTIIGTGALQGQTKITEVILPDSVTTIGENAFYGCIQLKAIALSKSVSQIQSGAFGMCSALESITVDSGNTTYRSQNNCLIQDKTLVLGCKTSQIPADGSVTAIGPYAFEGCAGLTELTIPDTIRTIGEGAFRDCNDLTTLNLGNGVQLVGKRAFESCAVLAQIDLGTSVQTIDDFAFAYNHYIKNMVFPASLRYLGEEAFSNSTRLVDLVFQEGVEHIGKNCFTFCDSLTSVSLPDSLKQLDGGAFYSCEKLASLQLGNGLQAIGDSAFDGCKALTTLTIPDSVQTIGSSAFYECTNLRQVDLGNGVETIGTSAFESCSNLMQIHIPASVKTISKQVFAYCPAIEQMTVSPQNPYYSGQGNCIIRIDTKYLAYGCKNSVIPADGSVTRIDGYAFAGCTGLTSIVVPDTVTRIDAYAFYSCYRLQYMQLPFVGGESRYDNWLGFIFGGGPSQNDLFVPGTLKRVVITGGTTVGDSAFSKCSSLEEIWLPESVTSIGYSAFANCTKLQFVVYPGNLQTLKSSNIFDSTPYAMLRISKNQENTVSLVTSNDIRHQIGGLVTFLDPQGQLIEQKWYPSSAKIAIPTVPEKPADEEYTYSIVWEPMPDFCIGNQTIQLRYAATPIHNYVYVDNSDGTHMYICADCLDIKIYSQAHTYVNGFCVCGHDENDTGWDVIGVRRAESLLLEGTILINAKIGFVDSNGHNVPLDKSHVEKYGGILFWNEESMPANHDDAVLGTQYSRSNVTFVETYEGINEYKGTSHGIPAKNWGDNVYYRAYISINGQIYYGPVNTYSVRTYCEKQIPKDGATYRKLRPLLATMLNYGAAAQLNWDHNTDRLANSRLPEFVQAGYLDESVLTLNWDDALLNPVTEASAQMCVNFPASGAAVTAKSLILDGAVKAKITMGYKLNGQFASKAPADATIQFFFWDAKTYAALEAAGKVLTKNNATKVVSVNPSAYRYDATYGYEYIANSMDIPAKWLGSTFYVSIIITESDGTEYCNGVYAYSAEAYAYNQLRKTSVPNVTKDVIRWMVIYGEKAKAYFS